MWIDTPQRQECHLLYGAFMSTSHVHLLDSFYCSTKDKETCSLYRLVLLNILTLPGDRHAIR